MSTFPETFRCVPLACTLTRHGCGERHARAKNNGRTPGARVNERAIFAATCRDCDVGAAHARGERPDVMIAGLTARTTKTKTEEGTMPRGKVTMIEHNGVTKPLGQWAREAGLDTQTLRERLKRMPFSEAISRPLITPQESGAMSSGPGKKGKPKQEVTADDLRGDEGAMPKPKAVKRQLDSETATGTELDLIAAATGRNRRERETDAELRDRLHNDIGALVSDEPVVNMLVVGSGAHAFDVLRRLGFDAEDAGLVPAGRLILVRGAA